MMHPITNTEPVDNEFFLQDGAVYFSGLYENGLLKGVSPKDFCCWHYWGKSSTACFLGGIRLRGADPASFRVLNYAYAMDKTAVYTTRLRGRIGTVLRYAPRQTHLRLPIIWPVTRNIFTKTMR